MDKIQQITAEVKQLLDDGTKPEIIAELLTINKQMVYDIEKQHKPKPKSNDDYIKLFYDLGLTL
jgi:hypothetical protein